MGIMGIKGIMVIRASEAAVALTALAGCVWGGGGGTQPCGGAAAQEFNTMLYAWLRSAFTHAPPVRYDRTGGGTSACFAPFKVVGAALLGRLTELAAASPHGLSQQVCSSHARKVRVRVEIMGPGKYENVGKSQSVLIMIHYLHPPP
jgi:hypothetical protein